MGFRPNYFTCIAHLYLYYILLVPHTYASYIRHWCIFSHYEIQYKSFSISNMVSESLLWPFLSSLVFISVTPFFFNIASAITTIIAAFHHWTSDVIQPHPWVPDLQPPSLRSFTLHRPLSLASPLQTLPRLRFWSYHRDPFTSIYKTMKASTPSETACAPTRCSKFLYGWSRAPCAVTCLHAPPRASELRHAPPRAATRMHALVFSCWRLHLPRHLLMSSLTRPLTCVDFDRWLFLNVDFFRPGSSYPVFRVDFIFAVCFCILCL